MVASYLELGLKAVSLGLHISEVLITEKSTASLGQDYPGFGCVIFNDTFYEN